ncbi:universal stress protein [Pedobacter sp. P351]|uniref:universal stress protein n=1 Tax=Pedobacter superstes TaxID=3133441 RepID=UPI0030A54FA3
MKLFTAKFRTGNLDCGVIITPSENNRKFKVEMVTGDPNPVVLKRSDNDSWTIENKGTLNVSDAEFQQLGQTIDAYLDRVYSMKTVVILTDFSDAAFNAARYAAALTHQLGTSDMILYHSYQIISGDKWLPASMPAEPIDIRAKSVKDLEDLKHKLQPLVNKQTIIEIRTDERPLVDAEQLISEQQNAGLVVMGITGKSNLEQILVGSNAIKVARECSAPLLIVPKGAKFEEIKRVVFACDLRRISSTTPVHAIKTFIHALNADLMILYRDQDGRDHFNPDTVSQQTLLHRQWDDEKPEYHYIEHDDIADGIMQFALGHDIQLVITVPQTYHFFESLFHRSLTKKLAFHTTIPLLLLREEI